MSNETNIKEVEAVTHCNRDTFGRGECTAAQTNNRNKTKNRRGFVGESI